MKLLFEKVSTKRNKKTFEFNLKLSGEGIDIFSVSDKNIQMARMNERTNL